MIRISGLNLLGERKLLEAYKEHFDENV